MSTIEIFQTSFFVSFLGLIFIFVRNLPLIAEYKVKYIPKEKRFRFKLKKGLSEGKIKTIYHSHKIQEKIGHRIRILVLKTDNSISRWLKNVKEKKFHIENIYLRKPKDLLPKETRSLKEKIKGIRKK